MIPAQSARRGPTVHARLCRRALVQSLLLALGAHLLALGMLVWAMIAVFGINPFAAGDGARPAEAPALLELADGPGTLPVGPEDARRMLAAETARRKAQSPEALRRELKRLLPKADRISPSGIGEIGALLGVDPQQHQPRAEAEGPFDHGTASIQSIDQIEAEADRPAGYRVTLVDAEGRTTAFEARGRSARAFDEAYGLFRTFDQHPALGAIYHRMVKSLLPELMRMRPKAPSGPGTETGTERRDEGRRAP